MDQSGLNSGVSTSSQRILGDTAAAVGASHDGCVATAVLGAPVVAALGRHRSTAGTPKLAVKKTCGDAENMLTKWHKSFDHAASRAVS